MTYKLVFVKWRDIMADDNHWAIHDDCVDWANNINDVVEQAGFLIEVETDFIVMGDKINRGVSDSLSIFSGVTKIPRTNILEIYLVGDNLEPLTLE